jgi:hypothetical protein
MAICGRNINELHCDGIVYNISRQVNATVCLNTELKLQAEEKDSRLLVFDEV